MKRFVSSLLVVSLVVALSAVCLPMPGAAQDALKRKGLKYSGQQAGETEEAASAVQEQPGLPLSSIPILEKAVDPDSYVIGPFDVVGVTIMGPDSRTYSLSVLPEGDVLIPGIGPVHADGLTLTQFRRALSTKIDMYFRNIELYCYLETPALFRVFVTGEVTSPGVVAVSGVERVTDAIERAGSVKDSGSLRLITLDRGGAPIRIDLLRFVEQGDLRNNPFMRSGDRINVPPAGAHATISGRVKKPGSYEIVEGETIADLIDLAGGFATDALEDSVLLTRVESGGVETRSVPKSRFETPLRDLDECGVYDRLKDRRFVYVEGATNRTGRFMLAGNDGLADLIVRAGGLRSNADLTAAYIQKKDGTTIKVDLGDYLSPEPAKNLRLDAGDVLTIPLMRATVTVGGEVNEPGEFPYNGDLTIVQYIGLAGGPTKDGSVDRVAIYSPEGRSRSVGRDAHPDRGDVIIVKKSTYKIFGDFFSGAIRVGTIVVSILILNK
jgi:protein involved in polysaccharide export with SLBB domain